MDSASPSRVFAVARPALSMARRTGRAVGVGLVEWMAVLAAGLHGFGMALRVLAIQLAVRLGYRLDVLRRLDAMGAAFGDHIGHVVLRRAEPQMVWSDAWRIVAAVQDKQAVRDRPVGKDPSPAMGACFAPSVVSALHDSVRLTVTVARPDPAVVTTFDLRPEPFIAARSVHAISVPFAWREMHPDPPELVE